MMMNMQPGMREKSNWEVKNSRSLWQEKEVINILLLLLLLSKSCLYVPECELSQLSSHLPRDFAVRLARSWAAEW